MLVHSMDLFEGVLGEESEELEDWEVRVELHPLQMRGDKPVEEITALGKKPEERERREEQGKEWKGRRKKEEEGGRRKGEQRRRKGRVS